MNRDRKICLNFVKESVGLFLFALLAGVFTMGVMCLILKDQYILSSTMVINIINIMVVILTKGLMEREYSSFICARKALFRINILQDISIAIIETILLGGITGITKAYPSINESLHMVNIEKTLGTSSIIEFCLFVFLAMLFLESIITFDFMRTNGILKAFFESNNKNKKASIKGLVIYMGLSFLIGMGTAFFAEVENVVERNIILGAMAVVPVVFYIMAVKKVESKEFSVERV